MILRVCRPPACTGSLCDEGIGRTEWMQTAEGDDTIAGRSALDSSPVHSPAPRR